MWDLSSWTRDQTPDPCVARWILNHSTSREVLKLVSLGEKPDWQPLGGLPFLNYWAMYPVSSGTREVAFDKEVSSLNQTTPLLIPFLEWTGQPHTWSTNGSCTKSWGIFLLLQMQVCMRAHTHTLWSLGIRNVSNWNPGPTLENSLELTFIEEHRVGFRSQLPHLSVQGPESKSSFLSEFQFALL